MVAIINPNKEGPRGNDGERGPKGDQGDAGPAGEPGVKGDTGASGAKGDTGSTGAKGDKGDAGAPGAKGDKCDPGISLRIEAHTGTTNASGLFNVTFSTAFPSTPTVLVEPPANPNYTWVKVSASTTGFSYRLTNRAVLTVLGLEVLAGAVTNVNGASVRALVVEA